jgi:hypothetical protein
MLADHPIDPMILTTDLARAREFYGDRIGLEILLESDDFLTFRCGGDSRRRRRVPSGRRRSSRSPAAG